MKILAHRGYWKHINEKNSLRAIERAFGNGWGIETDVRDYHGKLVISHDIASEACPPFESAMELYASMGSNAFLAINIKADGIQGLFLAVINKYHISNYAVFDMSVPEQVIYRREGISYFARQSEIEKVPILYDDAAGVWMDEWERDWISEGVIKAHLGEKKKVGIISPEIHGRDYSGLWSKLKKINSDKIYLCTDIPMEAEQYFNEK